MPQIITFYSYKGGVGRTTALVNAAYVLAREGYRVLMVDLDLEAPGMTHFFTRAARSRNNEGLRDSIDLLLEAKRTLAKADSGAQAPEIAGSLEEFVVNIDLPREWRKWSPYLNGRLDLLPARIDSLEPHLTTLEPSDDYLRRLDTLDLAGIFSPDGPRHRFGDHLREYFLRARFDAPGDPLFVARENIRASYDFVLIDSRTGLNEISGLCVGPLCDSLVVCCGLNRQSIAGSRYFLDKVGLLESTVGKPYLVVAGPVPAWRSRESAERISILSRSLNKKDVIQMPYHPSVALEENVFVIDDPEEAISSAYRSLAREMRREFLGPVDQEPRRLDLGWDEVGGAKAVSDYLRRRRVQPLERPGSSLCRFPTASALAGMPKRGSLSPPQPGSYALSAAVASYWTGSDRAFRRAWDLFKPGAGRGLPRLSVTASKLALLELWVSGVFRGSPEDIETIRSIGGSLFQREDLRLESLLVVHLLNLGNQEITREMREMTKAWFSQPAFQSEWWRQHGVDLLPLFLSSDLDRNQLKALERAVSKLPKELLAGNFSRPDPVPFGFWPESLLISALSVVREGGKAVGEVLGLISALRDRHGYAWRVLVDWRHLDKLKETPGLRAFLREEDEMVDEIESAIDQGIYPL